MHRKKVRMPLMSLTFCHFFGFTLNISFATIEQLIVKRLFLKLATLSGAPIFRYLLFSNLDFTTVSVTTVNYVINFIILEVRFEIKVISEKLSRNFSPFTNYVYRCNICVKLYDMHFFLTNNLNNELKGTMPVVEILQRYDALNVYSTYLK